MIKLNKRWLIRIVLIGVAAGVVFFGVKDQKKYCISFYL